MAFVIKQNSFFRFDKKSGVTSQVTGAPTAAPGSFYPAPKVTSAVVRMEIRPQPAVQVEDEEGYFALVRAAFGQRRKTAANAIASGLGMPKDAVTAAIEAAGFDARIRPEALTLEDFAKIQQALAR